VASTIGDNPIVFDPACYFGDRETDLAMTELFGGFGRDFYAAYNDVWELDSGYQTRKHLYNLYHVLNHLNLFGGNYVFQAETMMKNLVQEVGSFKLV
jgi:fructosamine-3-kinase